jgi:hypothetical protein
MSQLVDRAIEAAGLGVVLSARREAASMEAHVARLRAADLLALGALADRVRTEEVGATVRIYTGAPPDGGAVVAVIPSEGQELTGLDLLREVAIARITGPHGARVRVDWTRCGLELAQVALGFGADELAGFIATKRGLPIADGELAGVGKKSKRELAQVVKRKELATSVERGGRVAVFIRSDGAVEAVEPGRPGAADVVGIEGADEAGSVGQVEGVGEIEAVDGAGPLQEAM